jgi:hypothetical protein
VPAFGFKAAGFDLSPPFRRCTGFVALRHFMLSQSKCNLLEFLGSGSYRLR